MVEIRDSPYLNSKCMIYYNIIGYNFALLDYAQQTEKYICDASLLKAGKYNGRELTLISDMLDIDHSQMSRRETEDAIYQRF